ncbi:MAG: J domain-containing protein [Magnetococcales bacterium]|nr:J domain-containing protein [Magnetococcales bacterium]
MTKNQSPPSLPNIKNLSDDAGYFERITWAREVMGLGESATLSEINDKSRDLLKKWHPDTSNVDSKTSHHLIKQILQARDILDGYCAQYKFSFSQKEVEKYLSPREWFIKRFGDN